LSPLVLLSIVTTESEESQRAIAVVTKHAILILARKALPQQIAVKGYAFPVKFMILFGSPMYVIYCQEPKARLFATSATSPIRLDNCHLLFQYVAMGST
jgi:hypothetical protein